MDVALLESLLPKECSLKILEVDLDTEGVRITIESTAEAAFCPHCHSESRHLNGRYTRQLKDRPCLGQQLHITLVARKFACHRAECPRKVFCERLPGLAEPQARTTAELADSHRSIGFALGGEAGARLAAKLSVPISPDTILRRVKRVVDEPTSPPRYVGIDDWACLKGQTYGTILIDLERRCVIDLLPGRDGEALKQWLAKNPQVEVITRDRWPAYIEAANKAAPKAKQVADRFHLLRNVREAVEKLLSRHASGIREASGQADSESQQTATPSAKGSTPDESAVAASPTSPTPPLTKKEQVRREKQRVRQERFRLVKELTAQGLSTRVIARQLGIGRKVVQDYQRREECPDWNPGRTGATGLDAHAEFITEWLSGGNRNTADLFRLLKDRGYGGGYDAVRRFVNRRIGSSGQPGPRNPEAKPPQKAPPSARKLSFAVVKPRPGKRATRVLEHLRNRDPKLNDALKLSEELMEMIRRKNSTPLKDWVARATVSGISELANLATSMNGDAAAIQTALTESWSNGPVEGQVNRLKTIKRQMYGRAGMTLLRARVKRKG